MGNGIVEGYFDGNTVTAMWNYAQNYALNDNFYGTTFGPSTPGALNVVAGNTYPATPPDVEPKVVRNPGGQDHRQATSIPPAMYVRSPSPTRSDGWSEHRRPAERGRLELGIVHGRIRSDCYQSQWDDGM